MSSHIKRVPAFKEAPPLSAPFRIRVYVKGVGLDIQITSSDPYNLLLVSAALVKLLNENDMEPTIEIQP